MHALQLRLNSYAADLSVTICLKQLDVPGLKNSRILSSIIVVLKKFCTCPTTCIEEENRSSLKPLLGALAPADVRGHGGTRSRISWPVLSGCKRLQASQS